jgi:hypothetical protein
MADEFFGHYAEQKVDAIIMIADSAETRWRRDLYIVELLTDIPQSLPSAFDLNQN